MRRLIACLVIIWIATISSTSVFSYGMTLYITNHSNKPMILSFDSNSFFQHCDSGENVPIKIAPHETKKEWCGYKDNTYETGKLSVYLKNDQKVDLAKFTTNASHDKVWGEGVRPFHTWGQSGLTYFERQCHIDYNRQCNSELTRCNSECILSFG